MILLWDVEGGMTQIDKFQYTDDDYVTAGACMAFGLLNAGIKNECDPAFALLLEPLESQKYKSIYHYPLLNSIDLF